MNEVIIATKNRGKAREFEDIFRSRGYEIRTLLDYPEIADIDETGNTFEENAILKAEAVSATLNKLVISDDSGLVIDSLDGRPGIFSARYAGEQKNDEANIDKVLEEMSEILQSERTARFYCALALAAPGQKTLTVFGTCEGKILGERRGTNGFGYDPIFFVSEKGISMAELSSAEKNQISHRANAIQKLDKILDSFLESDPS
jgi:XTP/dITP diphosphohydrolase